MKTLKITLTFVALLCLGSSSLFARDATICLRLVPPHFSDLNIVTATIVERREKGNARWVRYPKFRDFKMTICIDNLIEGNIYEFRVILESNYGLGKASKPTEPIQATLEYNPELGVFCEEVPYPFRSNYVMLESRETGTSSVLPSFCTVEETKIPFRQ